MKTEKCQYCGHGNDSMVFGEYWFVWIPDWLCIALLLYVMVWLVRFTW